MTSPSGLSINFHLPLSGDPEAAAAGFANVGIALYDRVDAALLDWIPFDRRLCAVRPRILCKVNSRRSSRPNSFVVLAYAPTDCSQIQSRILSSKSCTTSYSARRSDTAILAVLE